MSVKWRSGNDELISGACFVSFSLAILSFFFSLNPNATWFDSGALSISSTSSLNVFFYAGACYLANVWVPIRQLKNFYYHLRWICLAVSWFVISSSNHRPSSGATLSWSSFSSWHRDSTSGPNHISTQPPSCLTSPSSLTPTVKWPKNGRASSLVRRSIIGKTMARFSWLEPGASQSKKNCSTIYVCPSNLSGASKPWPRFFSQSFLSPCRATVSASISSSTWNHLPSTGSLP